jgi:glycosyltransferase Alg8
LYFGQIFGAAIKTYVMFRLDRQRWTRQSTGQRTRGGLSARLRNASSASMHVLAVGLLVCVVLLITGLASPIPFNAN